MKRASLIVLMAVLCFPIAGCLTATSTTPPAALAPGYNSTQDQQFGQAMAALRAFDVTEVQQYQNLTPTQQAGIKSALNSFTLAVNTADTLYLAYHGGVTPTNPNPPTATQVSQAISSAQNQQAPLNSVLGVK